MSLGCAAAAAHAESFFQLEAGIGMASYTTLGDGLYFQRGLSHHFDLHVPAFRAGIVLNARDYHPGSWVPGIAFNLTYLNFGRVAISGMAAPDKDAYYGAVGGYYDPKTETCAGPCRDIRDFQLARQHAGPCADGRAVLEARQLAVRGGGRAAALPCYVGCHCDQYR